MRARNEVSSVQHRLPDELWTACWEYLPFADRVNVSQVGAQWRKIAVACPRLWCDLEFNALRLYEGGDAEDQRTIDSSSLIATAIKRSMALPLSVTASIKLLESGETIFSLAEILKRDVDRLQHLRVTTQDPASLCWILNELRCLPALRSLSFIVTGFDFKSRDLPYIELLNIFGEASEMPQLEILDTAHRIFGWSNKLDRLLNLTRLSIGVNHQQDICHIFQTCTRLDVVTLGLRMYDATLHRGAKIVDQWTPSARKLSFFEMRDIPYTLTRDDPGFQNWDVLREPRLPNISLHFSPDIIDEEFGVPLSLDALTIFGDLKGPLVSLHLEHTDTDTDTVISATTRLEHGENAKSELQRTLSYKRLRRETNADLVFKGLLDRHISPTQVCELHVNIKLEHAWEPMVILRGGRLPAVQRFVLDVRGSRSAIAARDVPWKEIIYGIPQVVLTVHDGMGSRTEQTTLANVADLETRLRLLD
ncbi:hypothetical protein BKA62DRAFT_721836 [Auriculariales sp. MPI-PUGE-AT-0066]|nr:hypothetical protein BKA62DRAFT_721836 [Auriculariales sp. MPI-PUGE-AT-0066]